MNYWRYEFYSSITILWKFKIIYKNSNGRESESRIIFLWFVIWINFLEWFVIQITNHILVCDSWFVIRITLNDSHHFDESPSPMKRSKCDLSQENQFSVQRLKFHFIGSIGSPGNTDSSTQGKTFANDSFPCYGQSKIQRKYYFHRWKFFEVIFVIHVVYNTELPIFSLIWSFLLNLWQDCEIFSI